MNIIEHDVSAELLTTNMQDSAVTVSLRHDVADPSLCALSMHQETYSSEPSRFPAGSETCEESFGRMLEELLSSV
ncbi:hypothetical protein [Streptomyces sp. T028]|uniref:hypothetical protein n=1 Tax=Streptomyces sp. T028 TaxID=3394379 RepID=UPI003A87933C